MEHIEEEKIETYTPQKKLIVGSEKLFLNSPRQQFLNSLSGEHDIKLLAHDNDKDNSPENLREKAKVHYKNIFPYFSKTNYSHRTFIGYGNDGYLLFELFLDKGLTFDAAVLVNCEIDQYPNSYNHHLYKIKDHTKIYNLYGQSARYNTSQLAQVNQLIPTRLSPMFSKRFAQETYGVLVYGVYGQTYLEDTPPNVMMVGS